MSTEDYKPQGDELKGFVGHLDAEQTKGLQGMWDRFIQLTKHKESPIDGVDVNKDASAGDGSGGDGDKKAGGAEAFGSQPKDDKAKDKAAAEKEKKELAALLGAHGPEKFRDEFWTYARGINPDSIMLRFLRARKWDVDRGFMMLAGAIKWRIEFGVQEIKEKGEAGLCDEEGFRIQYDKAKSYTHGTDKKGRPIVFIHVAKHIPKEQSQKSLERFTVFNMEAVTAINGWREQGTLIFDMTGFGLKNMDWQCISFIVKCFEAYYPETLGLCCVHKAPFVFNAIWKVLAPLLDPVVRSKIDFTNSDSDLAKHIDPTHIPKGMGGKLDWEWRYDGPIDGENDLQKDTQKKEELLKLYNEAVEAYEDNTEKWIKGDEGAEKEREKLWKRLAIRHYDLDPYVRGKTVYARDGIDVGDGTVVWKYNGGEEQKLGDSADDWRDEAGIEGKCPRNGNDAESRAIQAADQQLKDEGDQPPVPTTGGKGKVAGLFSKMTPGPSKADKDKKATEEFEERRSELIEQKKTEIAEEEKKRADEAAKKAEEEKKTEQANAGATGAIGGAVSSVSSTFSNLLPSGGSSTANGENKEGGGVLNALSPPYNLAPTLNAAADYVPAAVGGDKLKEATQMENGAAVEAKSDPAPGEKA